MGDAVNNGDGMAPDQIDCQILECYRQDPRMSARAVGAKVNLSENAVRDRTKKLISTGILTFAVAIDHDRISSFSLEAYVEVAFPGDADVHSALQELVQGLNRQQIREAMTLVGDVDAMIRVRARNVAELRELVSEIRSAPMVVGTKTRIVAGRWWHGTDFGLPKGKRAKKRPSRKKPPASASPARR
ncbi:MAG TPA: Lrp/AsnC family transcriptional regulator [Solirubrobacterales bacterium]|nr:Lrp/AsnC family transcriptional regulator [Solirubrobacterales bacterium]